MLSDKRLLGYFNQTLLWIVHEQETEVLKMMNGQTNTNFDSIKDKQS